MGTDDLRSQVRDFLTSRRARITPQQAGLPAYGGGTRRVSGLRREEVALLAGVSLDYYVRMERGQLGGASDAVLSGLADALQLDEAEREHLHALARASGPAPRRARPASTTVRPAVQQLLAAITAAPAWVRNARHDILAMNSLARALYSPVVESTLAGATARRPANTTRFLFLDPAAREFFVDYDRTAQDSAAMPAVGPDAAAQRLHRRPRHPQRRRAHPARHVGRDPRRRHHRRVDLSTRPQPACHPAPSCHRGRARSATGPDRRCDGRRAP